MIAKYVFMCKLSWGFVFPGWPTFFFHKYLFLHLFLFPFIRHAIEHHCPVSNRELFSHSGSITQTEWSRYWGKAGKDNPSLRNLKILSPHIVKLYSPLLLLITVKKKNSFYSISNLLLRDETCIGRAGILAKVISDMCWILKWNIKRQATEACCLLIDILAG